MRRVVTMAVAAALALSACGDDAAAPSTTTVPTTTVVSTTVPSTTVASTTVPTTTVPLTTVAPTTVAPTTVPAATPVTREMIANATVMIDDESVTLHDGRGDGPPFVRVVGSVIADVTGDGIDDAAVVLAHDYPGTTGRFSSLVLFHFPADELMQTEPIVYVDRGRTIDLRVEDSAVVLRWSERMFWDRGEQTIATYSFDGTALQERDTEVSVLVEGSDVGFRFDQSSGLDFGASLETARAALVSVLGEPSEEGFQPTCWGRQDHLQWDSPAGTIVVVFLGDEFFDWWASDPRVLVEEVVSPGASLAWLEQWFQTEFTTFDSELGGTFVNELEAPVTVDAASRLVNTVAGRWSDEWGRLHTEIVDPIANPDIWCGD